MKAFRLVFTTLFLFSTFFFFACSGGSGGSDGSDTGDLSMSITDAKPALPVGVTNFYVTIEEVLVHKSGGKWKSLELVESPYTIDLLQFVDGNITELIPPVPLEVGKYTQVRMIISSAFLIVLSEDQKTTNEYPVTIPSEKLKTDKNFDIDLDGHGVDITVDFDLSQSLVAEGQDGGPPYKLNPVLHVVETSADVILSGTIDNTRYTTEDPPQAIVTVSAWHAIEQAWTEYTKVVVPINTENLTTNFSIYWLVPDENYLVEIDLLDIEDYVEEIDPNVDNIGPGSTFLLNEGNPI